MENILLKEKTLNTLPIYTISRTASLYFFEKRKYILKCYKDGFIKRIPLPIRYQKLQDLDQIRPFLETFPELVLPEYYVFQKDEFIGFLMKYYPHLNITTTFDIKTSLSVIKQLGLLLQNLQKMRMKEKDLQEFFLGDLQLENLLYLEDETIRLIDLDGCATKNVNYEATKYFSFLHYESQRKILSLEKYLKASSTTILPNQNSDLFYYTIILFQLLFHINILDYSFVSYERLLQDLRFLGLPSSLYQCLFKIYQEDENENPYPFLEDISLSFIKDVQLQYSKKNHLLL